MDTKQHTPSWNRIQERWIAYAQSAKTQWPDIRFDDLLSIGGGRAALCQLVADTYGLDTSSADHAVQMWHLALTEWSETPPEYTAA